MTRALLALVVVLAAGCGRRRFDDLIDGAPGDVPVADAALDAKLCAHTFCDDFDRVGTVADGWDSLATAGTGQGAIMNGQFLVTLGATGDSAYLIRQFPAPTTSLTIGMKIGYAVTNAGTDCEVDLARINWNMGTCLPFGFYLVRDGTGPFNLQETNGNMACSGNRNNYFTNLDNTGLHDVKLTITLGAANVATAAIEIDGTPEPTITTVRDVVSSTLRIAVGAVVVRNLASAWTVTYEDVYVDIQ